MAIKTPEDFRKEVRNLTLMGTRAKLQQVLTDLEFLINATPSGERRNQICDLNLRTMLLADALQQVAPE